MVTQLMKVIICKFLVYFLVEGRAVYYLEKYKIAYQTVFPNSYFGEYEVLFQIPRFNTVICFEKSNLLYMLKNDFYNLVVKDHFDVAKKMSEIAEVNHEETERFIKYALMAVDRKEFMFNYAIMKFRSNSRNISIKYFCLQNRDGSIFNIDNSSISQSSNIDTSNMPIRKSVCVSHAALADRNMIKNKERASLFGNNMNIQENPYMFFNQLMKFQSEQNLPLEVISYYIEIKGNKGNVINEIVKLGAKLRKNRTNLYSLLQMTKIIEKKNFKIKELINNRKNINSSNNDVFHRIDDIVRFHKKK